MVNVNYSHRILSDGNFPRWLSNHKETAKIKRKLMYIKSTSDKYRRKHNVILETEHEAVLRTDPNINKWLGECFKKVENPSSLNNYEGDSISQNIVFAIQLNWIEPLKCYIFTSPEKKQEYEDNLHLQGIKNIEVKSGEEAVEIINKFFQQFEHQRDAERINRGLIPSQ